MAAEFKGTKGRVRVDATVALGAYAVWTDVTDTTGDPDAEFFQVCSFHLHDKNVTREQRDANAVLIADAFNVRHETGLTPRELAGQNAALLEAIRPFAALLADHHAALPDDAPLFAINENKFTVGDVRNATAALAKAMEGTSNG